MEKRKATKNRGTMNIKLKPFGFINYLRILSMTLDKKYSKEREDTFFSYLLKGLKSVFQKDSYEFTIFVNGKFAGNIGFFNSKNRSYELGYMILRNYRGKGVATNAINKIIKLGFKELNISKIFAITDFENKESQKVLIKNKFKLIKREKNKEKLIWERRR